MDAAEYRAWQEQNDSLYTVGDRAATPCDDCLAAHALEMRAEGKCYVWDGTRLALGRPRGWEDDDVRVKWRQEDLVAAARRSKNSKRAKAIREAMRLRELGLTAEETGRVLGVGREAVYRYWHDGRRAA